MKHRLLIIATLFAFLGLTWTISRGGDPPKKIPPAEDTKEAIMRRKLVQAQKVLEALALNDFDKLRAAADELAILRQKAEWRAIKTRDYELFTNDFQRQIEGLQKAAKDKNIDGATLAYVNMTLTCVACHKYVRESGVAKVPTFGDRQLVRRTD